MRKEEAEDDIWTLDARDRISEGGSKVQAVERYFTAKRIA